MEPTVYIPPATVVDARYASRQKLWHGLRLMPRFTADDLAVMTDVSVDTVREFLAMMARYGYVHVQYGGYQKPRQHSFVNNTGPKTPYFVNAKQGRGSKIQRVLYDPNLKRIVYPA